MTTSSSSSSNGRSFNRKLIFFPEMSSLKRLVDSRCMPHEQPTMRPVPKPRHVALTSTKTTRHLQSPATNSPGTAHHTSTAHINTSHNTRHSKPHSAIRPVQPRAAAARGRLRGIRRRPGGQGGRLAALVGTQHTGERGGRQHLRRFRQRHVRGARRLQ